MVVSIPCPRCGKKILLSPTKAFRGCKVACLHCDEQVELVGGLLAEVFWSANQR